MAKRRPSRREGQPTPQVAVPSWKDHPWAIAIGAGGATALFCVTLFMSVVLPTWTKREENRIVELEKELQTSRAERDKKAEELLRLEGELEKTKTEKGRISSEVLEMQLAPLFLNGSPYPRGFDHLKIGDPIDLVQAEFSPEVDDQEFWLSVKPQNSIFRSIAYYKYGEAPRQKIGHILFQFDSLREDGASLQSAIEQQLVASFGQPQKVAKKSKDDLQRCWRVGRIDVEFSDSALHLANAQGSLDC